MSDTISVFLAWFFFVQQSLAALLYIMIETAYLESVAHEHIALNCIKTSNLFELLQEYLYHIIQVNLPGSKW